MKTILSLVMSLLLGAAWTASASDDTSKDKSATKDKPAAKVKVEKSTKTKDAGKEELTTGSYVKQKVHRNGMITDGSSQVLVVDRSNIERSGASTVSQILNRYGAR